MDLTMDVNSNPSYPQSASKASEYRRVIKPLLERRRRARINQCLTELKNLILENSQQNECEASKLEKADILELTVKHLRHLRRSTQYQPAQPESLGDKFKVGFAECAREVSTCVSAMPGLDGQMKHRLISHLADRFQNLPGSPASPSPSTPPPSPATSPFTYCPSAVEGLPCTPNTPRHFTDSLPCTPNTPNRIYTDSLPCTPITPNRIYTESLPCTPNTPNTPRFYTESLQQARYTPLTEEPLSPMMGTIINGHFVVFPKVERVSSPSSEQGRNPWRPW